MKKLVLMLGIAVMSAGIFSSCSDDKDKSVAGKVKGTYTVNIKDSGTPSLVDEKVKKLNLTKASDNTLDLKLEKITIAGDPKPIFEGEIVIQGVAVTEANKVFTLKKDNVDLKIKISGEEKTVKVSVNGTIKDRIVALDVKVTEVPVINTLNLKVISTPAKN